MELVDPSNEVVIVESPFRAAEKWRADAHLAYARACIRDCIDRGEVPFASHLLYTQPTVLDDTVESERRRGIEMGQLLGKRADFVAVYTDMGLSDGMRYSIAIYEKAGKNVIYRRLNPEARRRIRLLMPNGHKGMLS